MTPVRNNRQQGYILVSVILAIALISSIAFLLNREGVVNTHLVTDEAQNDEVRYVAEAALNHARWLMDSLDCSGYTNIPDTPFGPNTYSASLNQSSGSPVTVTATGQLANGVTQTVTFKDIKVMSSSPITMTLQPDATAGKDTYLRSGNRANRNYGGSNMIHVERNRRNGLVEFDLSTIPAGATLVSATLELFLENDGNNAVQIDVHRVTQAWVEGTKTGNGNADGATWNDYDGSNPWASSGGDFDPAVVASTIVPTGNNTWHQWDITALVSDWLNNTVPNNGILLEQVGPRDRVQFASSENGNATLNPKLTITYIGECGSGGGPPPGSTTVLYQPTADTYIDRRRNRNHGGNSDLRTGDTFSSNDRYRTLVRFDDVTTGPSTIPPLSVINSVVLRFYVSNTTNSGGADIDIDVNPVTSDWVEGTGTGGGGPQNGATWDDYDGTNPWTSAGGDYDPGSNDVLTVPNGDSDIWIEVDITPLVQEWVDGIRPNYGVILREIPERVDMNSRENATDQPELVITYTPPS